MGEYAEMCLNGDACPECGELFFDDNAEGFPRLCAACEPNDTPPKKTRIKSVPCPACTRTFHSQYALAQHRAAKAH